MAKKKTHKEYIAELVEKNPTVEVVEEYNGTHKKIMHHCILHDVYWKAEPYNILHGCGCQMCKKEKIGLANRKSKEQYVREVKNINPNIVVVEQYVDSFTPILHRCTIHNIEWKAQPISILNGSGCYECGIEKLKKQKIKSNEQYINELKIINPNIIAIEKYIDSLTPILHKCLIDEYEWHATPANILYGKGCPKCAGNARKTHDEYVNEVAMINSDVEVVEQYINATTSILHKCKIDGNTWQARPSDILHGKGCPKCNESKGEKYIRQWLDKYNVEYEKQKTFDECRDIKPLPFDFYLSNYNCCIEYDGEQHYEPIDYFGGQESFEIRVKHDNIKNDYCKSNGISLLRIPYFKNVEEELNNFLFI